MNVVVTGGGTGGHFYPAYMLYEKLKNSGKIAEIYYFGSDYGIEKKLVAELNLNYRLLKARGFIGKSVFDKIKAIILNFYS
ncbi:MAG TPA: glycosyltransferase, partial [bacterium]|nr:glycosyltransferase [bacterium]